VSVRVRTISRGGGYLQGVFWVGGVVFGGSGLQGCYLLESSWSSPLYAATSTAVLFSLWLTSHRMSSHVGWLLEMSGSQNFESAVLHLRSCPHMLRIYCSVRTKKLPAMRRHICYIKPSAADWASLKWPQRRLYKGFKFHGCLWERKVADKRYDEPADAFGLHVCESQYHHAPYSLYAASLKWTDAATANCSQRLYRPWLQCSEPGSWCECRIQCARCYDVFYM